MSESKHFSSSKIPHLVSNLEEITPRRVIMKTHSCGMTESYASPLKPLTEENVLKCREYFKKSIKHLLRHVSTPPLDKDIYGKHFKEEAKLFKDFADNYVGKPWTKDGK